MFGGNAMSTVNISSNNFNKIIDTEKTILLDFYADWCGPCQIISPIIKEIANENENIIVGKINVDEEGFLAEKFNITSIPTIIVIKNHKITNQVIGLISKDEILQLL